MASCRPMATIYYKEALKTLPVQDYFATTANMFHHLRRRHTIHSFGRKRRSDVGEDLPEPQELLSQSATLRPTRTSTGDLSTAISTDELGSSNHGTNGATRRRHSTNGAVGKGNSVRAGDQGRGSWTVNPTSRGVTISMDVPEGAMEDDFHVKLRDGVLGVEQETKDEKRSGQHLHDSTFSVDEQILDVDHAKARLSKTGVLDITLPKLDDKEITKRERIPISPDPPPQLSDALTILMDPPGVGAEDLYIHYSHGHVEISGECRRGRLGNFKRTVPVDVELWDPDAMKAYFYRDTLVILVPSRKEHVNRDIDIKKSGSQGSMIRLSSNCSSEDLELLGAVRHVDSREDLATAF